MDTTSEERPEAQHLQPELLITLDDDRQAIRRSFLEHLQFTLAELPDHVDSQWEPYVSLALAVRDRLIESWIRTHERYYARDAKRVYYLSLEFLMGRTLGNAMLNLGVTGACVDAVTELG